MTMKLTHLSRRRDHWPWDLNTDGWVIRFTGDTDEWDELRADLKTWGWDYARWLPDYQWDDNKKGAWWVDADLFRDVYIKQFANLSSSMMEKTDDTVQWFYKGKRGWEGSHPSEWYRQQYQPKQDYSAPLHLKEEYRVLGISGNATLKEIKDAYRALAKKHHPDAGGSHLAFIVLQQAYERVTRWVERIAS